jgi:hypothetical protein
VDARDALSNATSRVADTLNKTATTVVGSVDVDAEGVALNGTALKGLVRPDAVGAWRLGLVAAALPPAKGRVTTDY